jgi:DNA-directed RNA polymerase subunit RPC12/RpoP
VSSEREASKTTHEDPDITYDSCPHCGQELSPWQQVLLTVDRALVCRHCWYRIMLDVTEIPEKPNG